MSGWPCTENVRGMTAVPKCIGDSREQLHYVNTFYAIDFLFYLLFMINTCYTLYLIHFHRYCTYFNTFNCLIIFV